MTLAERGDQVLVGDAGQDHPRTTTPTLTQ